MRWRVLVVTSMLMAACGDDSGGAFDADVNRADAASVDAQSSDGAPGADAAAVDAAALDAAALDAATLDAAAVDAGAPDATVTCSNATTGTWGMSYATGGFVVANMGGIPYLAGEPSHDIVGVDVNVVGGTVTFDVTLDAAWDSFAAATTYRDYMIAFARPGQPTSPDLGVLNGTSDLFTWTALDGSTFECYRWTWTGVLWANTSEAFCTASGTTVSFAVPETIADQCGGFRVASWYTVGPELILKAISNDGIGPNGPLIPMPFGGSP